MKCRYLKNVTSLSLNRDACIGCGRCLEVCPHAVFKLDLNTVEIVARDACIECGACAKNCPANAIAVRAGTGCATGFIYAALGQKNDCCRDGNCC